jgi:hypothetical protein
VLGDLVFIVSPNWLQEKWSSRDRFQYFDKVCDVLVEYCEEREAKMLQMSGGSELGNSQSSFGEDSGFSSLGNSLAYSQDLMMSTNNFDTDGSLQLQIDEANNLVTESNDNVFSLVEDLCLVRCRFSLDNFSCCSDEERITSLAQHFGIEIDTKISVDFSYMNAGSPLASVSLMKDKRTQHDTMVSDWIRDIVKHTQETYLSDRRKLRHYGQDSTVESTAKTQLASISKKFMSKKQKGVMEEEIMKEEAKFMSEGGIFWNNKPRKNTMANELVEMGFSMFDVVHHLDEHKSVEQMVDVLATLEKMKVPEAAQACLEAMAAKGHSKLQAAKILLANNFNVPKCESELAILAESFKKHSPKILENFFLSFLEFLSERLRNYRKYCISCHSPHNCNPMSAVVCAKTLCVFRWEEFRLQQLIPSHQCCFEDCGTTNWAKKCLEYFGESVEQVAHKYGLDSKTVLEMAFHKYLPKDEMLKFFAVIKQLNAKNVRNCLSPDLCVRFEKELIGLTNAGRKLDELKPHVAYHGTSSENVRKIAETGFMLSKLAANTGNRGYYGAGIYCSPQANYCMGYCRGGKELLVCAVLMGKRWKCPQMEIGCAKKKGYDSHTDPTGMAEWVLYEEAKILPCFILSF